MGEYGNKTLSSIGERELVDLFMNLIGVSDANLLPHPDDAVAVRFSGGVLVFKTDMFVASTDMPPMMRYYDAGWKTVVMNVSDVISKGANPLYFIYSMGVPRSFKLKDALEVVKGIRDSADVYGMKVLGGDLGECRELVISGFIVGSCPSGRLMPRRGAKPGDLLAVTGCFGLTSAALKTFMQGLQVDGELIQIFKDALFKPKAKVKEALALAESSAVTSSIDSSDGLLESLLELAKINKVGFIVEDLPVCVEVKNFAIRFGLNLEDLVFKGGEEYELVVTLKPLELENAIKAVKNVGGELKVIGRVIDEPGIFYEGKQGRVELKGGGYEHFKNGLD